MSAPPRPPLSARVGILLVFANALLWLLFAIIVFAGLHPSYPYSSSLNIPMAALASLAAFAMGFFGLMLGRRKNWAYILTIVALATLIVLTIADEVGLLDIAVLLLELVPLVLLLKTRRWFLGDSPSRANLL